MCARTQIIIFKDERCSFGSKWCRTRSVLPAMLSTSCFSAVLQSCWNRDPAWLYTAAGTATDKRFKALLVGRGRLRWLSVNLRAHRAHVKNPFAYCLPTDKCPLTQNRITALIMQHDQGRIRKGKTTGF